MPAIHLQSWSGSAFIFQYCLSCTRRLQKNVCGGFGQSDCLGLLQHTANDLPECICCDCLLEGLGGRNKLDA